MTDSRIPGFSPNSIKIKHLVGIGFDHSDGHKRLTQADQFSVIGGSEPTHERITVAILKTCEDLGRKGKKLQDAEIQEVKELLHKHSND